MDWYLHRAAALFAAGIVITACGGSESGRAPDATERINGVAVPLAPDPVANAATVAGVDTDGNGVRDDIDRQLATKFGGDASRHALAVRVNRTLQAALVDPSPTAVEAHVREVTCIGSRAFLDESAAVTRATINTPERARAYAAAFAGAGSSPGGCP